ncbi:hypothetical protein TWF730_000229 [Orbilia blumenaviensis]|uniref:Uncharacterized protein n=1 Tax=Orbilia blumenaviensis TaxID=1796055 RepID=A0AAV9VS31_9PEZI
MKSTFATALILFSGLSQAVFLKRTPCSANNVVRAAERLQRESNWCATWLAGTTTISIPPHIATTPIPIISSACSCVYTPTACQVTVTATPPPPPEPTEHVASFEDNSTPWVGFMYLDSQGRGSYGVHTYSASSSPQQVEAFTGTSYYRGIFKFRNADRKHSFQFSNTKAFTVTPQTDYDITFHFRQFGYSALVCNINAQVHGSVQWDGDNISGGQLTDQLGNLDFTWQGNPATEWAKAVGGRVNTGTSSGIALLFSVDCLCPADLTQCEALGTITAAFDDIAIKVRQLV